MRLIDADAYETKMSKTYGDDWDKLHILESMPTIDAVEQKHGHWVWDETANLFHGGWVCSLCRMKNDNIPADEKALPKIYAGTHYCGQCGAEMGEVSDDV